MVKIVPVFVSFISVLPALSLALPVIYERDFSNIENYLEARELEVNRRDVDALITYLRARGNEKQQGPRPPPDPNPGHSNSGTAYDPNSSHYIDRPNDGGANPPLVFKPGRPLKRGKSKPSDPLPPIKEESKTP